MNVKNDLVDFIKKQIEIEYSIVNSLNEALKDINNQPVRGVLHGISLDSAKHAEMYEAALNLLTGVSQALSQAQLDEQRRVVEKHIRMEAELIERINAMLPRVEDEKVNLLLTAILADERRHHELLKQVLETIVHRETITEEDWWRLIWENVPFYGAPGG